MSKRFQTTILIGLLAGVVAIGILLVLPLVHRPAWAAGFYRAVGQIDTFTSTTATITTLANTTLNGATGKFTTVTTPDGSTTMTFSGAAKVVSFAGNVNWAGVLSAADATTVSLFSNSIVLGDDTTDTMRFTGVVSLTADASTTGQLTCSAPQTDFRLHRCSACGGKVRLKTCLGSSVVTIASEP